MILRVVFLEDGVGGGGNGFFCDFHRRLPREKGDFSLVSLHSFLTLVSCKGWLMRSVGCVGCVENGEGGVRYGCASKSWGVECEFG